MHSFIKNIILFSILALVIVIAIEFSVRSIPNTYQYKDTWMQSHADDLEIMILGSSHTHSAIDPTLWPKSAFNLANSSQTLEFDEYLLTHYLPLCQSLKTVILPISYPTFYNEDVAESDTWFRSIYYSVYMDYDKHPKLSKYRFFIASSLLLKNTIISSFYKSKHSIGELGQQQQAFIKKKTDDWDNSDQAIKDHTRPDTSGLYYQRNLDRLNRIAALCKQNNIQLVLLSTPCWHTYCQRLEKPQLEGMYAGVKQLLELYPDVKYYDYLRDPRFISEDFSNSDHLSNIGARKFSEIIYRDCLNY